MERFGDDRAAQQLAKLPKATAQSAVQGRRLPWLWCFRSGHLLVASRPDRQQPGAPNDLRESRYLPHGATERGDMSGGHWPPRWPWPRSPAARTRTRSSRRRRPRSTSPAGAAPGDALSRGHRQHRGDQECRSGRARAGLPAIDRLPGRHLRQAGHPAVHDRARHLQAEARPGAGGRGRRAGLAAAGRGRLQAAERSRAAAGGSQATLDTSTSTRDNAQANLQQAQANTRLAEVNYGYTKVDRAVRRHRHRASWSRSANSSASPRRPSSRPSSRSTRSM